MGLRKMQKNRKIISVFVVLVMILQCLPWVALAQSSSTVYPAPIAQWQFNENQGNTVADATNNGHNGIIKGATLKEGKFGNALYFDGNDYVEVAQKADLSIRNTITVEAWINPSEIKVWQRIVSKTPHPNTDYCMFLGDKNRVGFSVKIGECSRTAYSPINTLKVGTWTHVVGTYDGNRVRIYLNGKQVNSIITSGKINVHNGSLTIGGDPKGDFFKGLIDEVCIYNKALTAKEILARFQVKEQVPEEPKVGPLLVKTEMATNGQKILLTFNKGMGVLPAAPAGFKVFVNNVANPVEKVSLNNNKAIIEVTLKNVIYAGDSGVTLNYTATDGKIKADDGGILDNLQVNVANKSQQVKLVAPKDITAKSAINSITLTWGMVPNAETYEIECDGTIMANQTATSYIHNGLAASSTHKYRVRAKNKLETGPWSELLTAVTDRQAPVGPSLTKTEMATNGQKILLTFNKEMGALPAAPAGFKVFVNNVANPVEKVSLNSNKAIIEITLKNVIFAGDSGVTLNYTAVDGKIKAADGGILGNLQVNVANKSQQVKLVAPKGITAKPAINSITLTWGTVPNAETYEIECDGKIMANQAATSYIHDGLAASSTHKYRVRAKNKLETGPWSEQLTAVTDRQAPVGPSLIKAEVSPEGQKILLTFNKEMGALPAAPAGFEVYVSDPNYPSTAKFRIKDVSLNSNKAIIEITLLETIYAEAFEVVLLYDSREGQIKADDGAILADLGEDVVNKSQRARLGAPKNMQIAIFSNYVHIYWDKVPNAETYELEFNGTIIAAQAANYFDHNIRLVKGTLYTYRLRAKNEQGYGPWIESKFTKN